MEFQYETNRVFALDPTGTLIAEITFPVINGTAEIDHTFVDDSLRGQGIAAKLMQAATKQIRSQGLKAVPTCSYAARWFLEHPEQADLLV